MQPKNNMSMSFNTRCINIQNDMDHLVLIVYSKSHSLNMHAHLSSGARGLNLV